MVYLRKGVSFQIEPPPLPYPMARAKVDKYGIVLERYVVSRLERERDEALAGAPNGASDALSLAAQDDREADATPATHSILTGLKAGETVCQTLFVPTLEFQTLKTLCQTLFVPKTASETLFPRPSMCLGCGSRNGNHDDDHHHEALEAVHLLLVRFRDGPREVPPAFVVHQGVVQPVHLVPQPKHIEGRRKSVSDAVFDTKSV